MKRILITLGLALLLAMLLPATSFGNNWNKGVMPPNQPAYGLTYAEWSARWWQWSTAMIMDNHPLADTAGCSRGQFGPVWFLGGNFTGASGGTRKCTVPAGKALFFPIVNVDCSSLEQAPFYGGTPQERRACARAMGDTAYGLSVQIDGVSLQFLTKYRATSPNLVFAVAPSPNVLGVGAGSGELVADGYYLLLEPLASGQHVIHFVGSFGTPAFTVEETYYITVK